MAETEKDSELSQTSKQLIELEVRRVLGSIDAEREKALITTLKDQRDFLIGNTRWVVGGFFGVILIAAAAMTFVVGSRVDQEVIRSFVAPEASRLAKAQVEIIVEKEITTAQANTKETINIHANNARNNAIKTISGAVENQVNALLNDGLKEKIDKAAAEYQNLTTDELIARILPNGAVVAFDRDREIGKTCPKGWKLFSPAGGRFIVGAGQHENGLTKYPSFAEDNTQAIGGSEKAFINIDEMPAHNHPITSSPHGTDIHDGFGGSPNHHGLRPEYDPSVQPTKIWAPTQHPDFMGKIGGNQPHNNMPPYIALYFCKKD